jgi:hypothetical protein
MFLDIEEGKVVITPEGMTLTVVKDLYSRDRHIGKPWFEACITYAYYMYKKDGMFKNMLPDQKSSRICSEMLKGKYKMEDFESNSACKDMMNEYLTQQYTPTELLRDSIKTEIQELLNRIRSIPYVKKQHVEVILDVPDHEGIMTKMPYKVWVEIDNSDEKAKAIKLAETLIDYEAKLNAKIIAETKEQRKKNSKKRQFE